MRKALHSKENEMLTLAFIGIATAFALIVLKLKLEAGRYGDVALDFLAMATLSMFFGHTLGGMVIVVFASTFISIYLYFFPPVFNY